MITITSTRHASSKGSVSAPQARKSLYLAAGLFLIIPCSRNVVAQSLFDVWNTEQGLPQNSVVNILQTRDGYLWLATPDGLVRFDGAQFTVFNSGNSPGLKSNRITALFEDRDGVLWFGTEDSGLARYKDGTFTTYTVADGFPSDLVRQIRNDPDSQDNLLVYTRDGIIRWPEKRVSPRAPHDGLPHTRFKYMDRDGVIWFSDDSNLYKVQDGVETIYTHQDGLMSSKIIAFYQDRAGSLWIGNENTGIQRLKDGTFRSYTEKDGLPKSSVRVFHEDREGHLWVGTNNGGLVRLSYTNDDARYAAAPQSERMHIYTTADGLSSNTVISIYEDVEGSLWVGTQDNGLNRLRQQVITTYSQRDGLASNNIYPIYQDRAGNIWIGTWVHGLTAYRDGNFTQYTRKNSSICSGIVTSLAEDREGRLWIGGHGGLCWFKDGKFTPFSELLEPSRGGISAIYQDRKGGFWFGTDVVGLYRYHDGQLSHLTTQDGLPGASVHAILEDRDGTIWIGAYGGLVRFKDESFTVYTTQDGLASNRVRSLYQDNDGTLWIGTYDGGLSRYKEGKFTSYTTRDGLFNSGVFQILEDGHDNLWLSCNMGIYRVSKRELADFADGKIHAITSIAYGRADGMLNQECNGGTQPAGIKTLDGKLWFPTQSGVAIVDPEALPSNAHPPPVIIESAMVDREARGVREQLRIEPGQANLEIHYTGLSFIKPGQVKFKYKLEGADHDWIEAGSRRVAYYTHLSPGEYVFRVIAANADGAWNTEGAQIKVSVRPPFYRTAWFLLLSFALIVGAAVLFYRWRVARLKKEKLVQQVFSQRLIESQEHERQRIAAELHDGLGQSLVIIKNRALISLNAPANQSLLLAQMEEIAEAASAAISEVRGIASNLHPYHIDYLGLSMALKTMIAAMADASNIGFVAEIDNIDGKLSKEGEINLYRLIQEALNNVVKHSGASKSRVLLKMAGLVLDLRIEDDGKGFSPDSATQRSGLGLVGMGERARLLNAQYEIESATDKGTTIHLRMTLLRTGHES